MKFLFSFIVVILFCQLCLASTLTQIGCGTNCGSALPKEMMVEKPGMQNCTMYYYKQTVDHFSYALPTGGTYYFNQR